VASKLVSRSVRSACRASVRRLRSAAVRGKVSTAELLENIQVGSELLSEVDGGGVVGAGQTVVEETDIELGEEVGGAVRV
jgi:hypothetical protein